MPITPQGQVTSKCCYGLSVPVAFLSVLVMMQKRDSPCESFHMFSVLPSVVGRFCPIVSLGMQRQLFGIFSRTPKGSRKCPARSGPSAKSVASFECNFIGLLSLSSVPGNLWGLFLDNCPSKKKSVTAIWQQSTYKLKD